MQEEEVSGLIAGRHRTFRGYLSADAAVRARKERLPLLDVIVGQLLRRTL